MNAPSQFTMGLTIGDKHIADLLNPHPHEIDLLGIDANLRRVRRFSGNPDALTVKAHQCLARLIAEKDGAPVPVVEWSEHHDDHEGIIGDIPGPLKTIIAWHTPVIGEIEEALDQAICAARGHLYPTLETRMKTSYYDKAAETVEWVHVLGRDPAPWNKPTPAWLSWEMAEALIDAALWRADHTILH